MIRGIAVLVAALALSGCSPGNRAWLEPRACDTWRAQGFECVAMEGFQWGVGGFGTNYGGAQVWHRLRKIPDNGITYSGSVQRWGDTLQVYGPTAHDAIRP